MAERAPVFDQIIKDYLQQVVNLDNRTGLTDILAVTSVENGFRVPFFNQSITITNDHIINEKGVPPTHSASVVACKYLLRCPDRRQDDPSLCTYKDFRDAAPYVSGFMNTAGKPIADHFAGQVATLEAACRALGGRPFDTDVACQLAFQFEALPRVPIFLLFHDGDEDFPAQCTLLFHKDAAIYLDMECLAMVGGTLAHRLQNGQL